MPNIFFGFLFFLLRNDRWDTHTEETHSKHNKHQTHTPQKLSLSLSIYLDLYWTKNIKEKLKIYKHLAAESRVLGNAGHTVSAMNENTHSHTCHAPKNRQLSPRKDFRNPFTFLFGEMFVGEQVDKERKSLLGSSWRTVTLCSIPFPCRSIPLSLSLFICACLSISLSVLAFYLCFGLRAWKAKKRRIEKQIIEN